jgi:hypothetical protein
MEGDNRYPASDSDQGGTSREEIHPSELPLFISSVRRWLVDILAILLFSWSRLARIPSGIGLEVKVVKAENIRRASPGALVGSPYENILETAGTWQGGNGEDSSVVYVDGAVEKGNMFIGDISGRPRCSG